LKISISLRQAFQKDAAALQVCIFVLQTLGHV